MTEFASYAGLFAISLAAATILPLQSEAALVGLLLTTSYPVALAIGIASLGNILGSTINWYLGRRIDHFRSRPWFPASAASLDRAAGWYRRYGRWSLLLSWLPVVGDPLTVVAGMLREPLWSFVTLVTVAKTGRYLAVTAATLSWT